VPGLFPLGILPWMAGLALGAADEHLDRGQRRGGERLQLRSRARITLSARETTGQEQTGTHHGNCDKDQPGKFDVHGTFPL